MKKLIYILPFFIFLLFFNKLSAQSPIPILTNNGAATHFVNEKGEVVFTLPNGHIPVTRYPSSDYSDIIHTSSNYNLDIFRNGICVVQTNDRSFYWINEKGTTIKDFKHQYAKMSPCVNGYVMAWKKIPKQGAGYMLVYLNKQGNNAFENRNFWEATPFSEGIAAVQEAPESEWHYINEQGEKALTLKDIPTNKIKQLHNFSNGLARVELKISATDYNTHSIYINKEGEKVIDVHKIENGAAVNQCGFFYQNQVLISFRRPNDVFYDLVSLDKKGRVLFKIESVSNHGAYFVNNLCYYTKAQSTSNSSYKLDFKILDKKGNTVSIPKEEKINRAYEFIDDFASVEISKDNQYWNALYSLPTLKRIISTPNKIMGYNQNYILTKTNNETYILKKHDGEMIWQTPIEEQLFTSSKEALPHKKQAKQLIIKKKADFGEEIWKLNHLETLHLQWLKIETLSPKIKKLKYLKHLKIQYLSKLKTLPASIAQLRYLETLEVNDCKSYKSGLEYIIANAPSLKEVTLININLEEGFLEKMKKQRPNLVINQFYQTEEIIEEGVIQW